MVPLLSDSTNQKGIFLCFLSLLVLSSLQEQVGDWDLFLLEELE